MSKSNPPYLPGFRQQLVEMYRAGRSPAELSREFGCAPQTITNWVGQAAIDDGKPRPGKEGLTTAEREELSRLRRQVRQLQIPPIRNVVDRSLQLRLMPEPIIDKMRLAAYSSDCADLRFSLRAHYKFS